MGMPKAAADSWRYFSQLDHEVRGLRFEIEWDSRHFPVYSPRLTILLSRIGNEADILFRQLCAGIERKDCSNYTMDNYRRVLNAPFSLSTVELGLRRIDHSTSPPSNHVYCPFDGFDVEKAPAWWKAYNKTKHARHDNPDKGNFENVAKGLGAILWLNILNAIPPGSTRADLEEVDFEYPHPLFDLQASPAQQTMLARCTALKIDPAKKLTP